MKVKENIWLDLYQLKEHLENIKLNIGKRCFVHNSQGKHEGILTKVSLSRIKQWIIVEIDGKSIDDWFVFGCCESKA